MIKKVFSKGLWKRILVTILIAFSFMFLAPEPVRAGGDGIGGKLAQPIVDVVVFAGDGLVYILHYFILGQNKSLIPLCEGGFWSKLGDILKIVLNFNGPAIICKSLINLINAGDSVTQSTGNVAVNVQTYEASLFNEDIYLPVYNLSPEDIFKGKVGIFNVNFFNTKSLDTIDGTNIAMDLQSTIAGWYTVLRRIAIVIMLSVLVYEGIVILISSSSANKAKYKQFLIDWLIGLAMLFMMHYGMSFGNILVDEITEIISTAKLGTSVDANELSKALNEKNIKQEDLEQMVRFSYYQIIPVKVFEKRNCTIKVYSDDEGDKAIIKDKYTVPCVKINIENEDGTIENNVECVIWATNLMGKMRTLVNYNRGNEAYAGYTVLFLMIVFLLIFFIFTYLKRVIYMAFLTLIAPFVALMYPIDKVKDGKAQSYDFWFKEYLYNLLLQPLHLLLYTILVTSAIELATKHVLYSIVALGFLVPAEKLVRQMFGFKGSTPGFFAGAAGSAMIMSGLNRLLHKPPKPPAIKDKGGESSSSSSSLGDNNPNKYGNLAESLNVDDSKDLNNDESMLNSNEKGEEKLDKGLEGEYTDGKYSNPYVLPNDNKGDFNSSNSNNGTYQMYTMSDNGSDYFKNEGDSFGKAAQHDAFGNMPNNKAELSKNALNHISKNKPQGKVKKLMKRAQRGVQRVSMANKAVARNNGKKLVNGIKKLPGKGARFVLRAGAGSAVALAAGTVALAAGAASGDMKTAITSAATGVTLGYKAGSNMAGNVVNKASENWNAEYSKAVQMTQTDEEKAKKFIKNEEIKMYIDRLNKEERKRLLKKDKEGKSYLQRVAENGKFVDSGKLVSAAMFGVENGIDANTVAKTHDVAETQGYTKMDDLGEKRRKDAMDTLHRQIGNVKTEKKVINLTNNLIDYRKKHNY